MKKYLCLVVNKTTNVALADYEIEAIDSQSAVFEALTEYRLGNLFVDGSLRVEVVELS